MHRRVDRIFYRQQRRIMQCQKCGSTSVVLKRCNRKTSSGHIKHMYCWICRKRTRHIQLGEA